MLFYYLQYISYSQAGNVQSYLCFKSKCAQQFK